MALNGRTAVVGLGSPIMCDDAVGLAVSRRVAEMGIDGVDCFEEAVGGLDILPLIQGYSHAVIADAIMTGGHGPGTVMIFREEDFDDALTGSSAHDVNLPTAIRMGRMMDPDLMPETVSFVAVEVQDIDTVSESMTPEVEDAVEFAVGAVLHLIKEIGTRGRRSPSTSARGRPCPARRRSSCPA